MSYIEGNQIVKTDFSANGQILAFNVAGLNSVRFEFSGTYAFTSVFETSNNSTNGTDGTWFPLQAAQTDASVNVVSHATANATRAYEASCHNDSWVRIRLSAFTSAGTHRVAIIGSTAVIEPVPSIPFPASQVIATPTGTAYSLVTAATNNLANIKATAGNLFEITVSNPTATPIYVKLYNKASAPVVASDVPALTIAVPATAAGVGEKTISFGQIGKRFVSGIAIAAVGAAAATDATNAPAGVQIHATYV